MKYIVGPLHSRRLGISLGVYIIPQKVCSLDCYYCEAGATTNLTLHRQSFYDAQAVLQELSDFLKGEPTLDYITFSGLGEPTLNSDIGYIISEIKARWPQYKLCLITNSTLLSDETLRGEVALCDVIIPSLDAVSEEAFHAINRPFATLKAADIVNSLIALRGVFANQMWLEIFFIEGINDTVSELTLLKEACLQIQPDIIHLNSLDRHGTADWVKKMPLQRLQEIKEFFKPLRGEIV